MARVLLLDGDTRQSLPMMRALRALGHRVTVACEHRLSVGWTSRYPHERVLLPSAEAGDEFVAALLALLSRRPFDVMIPLFDLCAHLVSQHRDELEKHTRIPLVSHDVFMLARDKAATMKACEAHGVPHPRTWYPDEVPIARIAEQASYPVLVKPRISHGAIGIQRVLSADVLAEVHRAAESAHGPCIVQEFVPEGGGQFKAQLFRGPGGERHAAVVYNKLRYFPIGGGTSSINQTVRRPDLIGSAWRLLDGIGWTGYADLDFIADPRDGVGKVMEINPRVTGSVKICFEAGVDFADLLVRQALGQPLPVFPDYEIGITMRYLPLDILWFLYSPDRFRARPSWFRFFGRDLCYQVLSLRDPLPFLAIGAGGLMKLLSREGRADKFQKRDAGRLSPGGPPPA